MLKGDASASTDSDRIIARHSRSVYQSVAGRVSKLSDRVTSGVGKAKERLTRSGRALNGGNLQKGTPVVPGRRSVPVPHTEGHKALFVEEVVYETPRLIGRRKDKGLLIINGAEMAIIQLQAQGPTTSSSDAFMAPGSSDTAVATVLVQHQLSKLIAVRQEGKVLSLEFAKSTSAKFTCKAEAFGFNCDDLSPAATAAAAAMAAERSGSSDSELGRVYSPPVPARSGLAYDPADFAPGTSPGLEASASAVSLGLEANSYSSSNRDGMEFAMQYFKESRTLKTVKGIASSIRSKGGAEEEEGEGPTRRLRAPNGREYRIQIDDFRLSFNDTTCAELALKLMQAGRQRMLKALSWLKRGLPFSQDSEISHVTEADAYRGGAEVLLSGPTLWGTQLQLPPGWAEAVLAAEPPEDGLTLQDLQVSQGPAAFKVYLSTPAGMAVAHLTPGLLADIWHSSSREGDILAVPVGANLTQIQQQQQQQQVGAGASQPYARLPSRPDSAAAAAAAAGGGGAQGAASPDLLPKQPTGVATNSSSAAVATTSSSGLGGLNGVHRSISPGGGSVMQRPGSLLQPTCSFKVGQLEDIIAGQAAGGGPGAAGAAAVMASVVGDLVGSSSSSRGLETGQGSLERQAAGPSNVAGVSGNGQPSTANPSSSSSARSGTHYRRASMPAIVGTGPDMPSSTAAAAAAAGASDDSLLQHLGAAEGRPLGRSKSDRALCDTAAKAATAGSGSSSPRVKSRLGHSSSSKHLGEMSGGSSNSLAAAAAAAVGSVSGSSRGRGTAGGEAGASNSSTFDLQASFADVSEVFAVIKVRMYTVDDDSAEALPGLGSGGSEAAGTEYMEDSASPFAVAAGSSGSPCKQDSIAASRMPSVIRSHSVTSAAPPPLGRQVSSTSSGGASRRDAYGVMCRNISGLLPDGDMQDESASTSLQPVHSVVLHSTTSTRSSGATHAGLAPASQQQAWSMLSTAAVLLCLASMLAGGWTTLLGRVLLVGAVALNLLLLVTSWHPQLLSQLWEGVVRLAGASKRKGRSAKQRLLHNGSLKRTATSTAAGGTGQPSGSQLVHLELIRAVFVRDSMGLLEKQQIMYRTVYGLGVAERQMTAEEVEALRAASGVLDGGDLESLVILISDPEPDWMTPDWKHRLIVARPTQEEREALARNVHQFRAKFQAATLLTRPPGHWTTFQAAFHYALLGMSPQGSPVLMLKIAMLNALPGELKRAGRTLEEFAEHMAFVWSFMFQELAPAPHPGGRYILLVDLGGMRSLSHMSACKVAGNHLGEVMGAFPERLCRCLVVNAPSWFNLIWRLVSPCLAEKTRAKVQVLTSEQEVVEELGRSVGADWVPAEYGGPCRLPYAQYPVQQQLNKFAAQLAGSIG